MSTSRRDMLRMLAAAAAASGTWSTSGPASAERRPGKPLRILILGGTGFLGPATIEHARARGHRVTIFHRGRTRPDLFPDVEKIMGDRDPDKGEGLKALAGKSWDVVIDNSGYYPRMVSASATLLAPQVRQYIYISSISAYKEPVPENGDETAPLATIKDPTVETMGKEFENYGGLKVLCEQAVERALPGRATIVRPGFIVGPDDPTGRFTYWPVRFSRGGKVAVPGAPTDPIQIIDVRDLGLFLVKLAEDNTRGPFNACGPERRLAWGELIALCQRAGGAGGTPVWVPADFLAKQKDVEFPIWTPYQGETRGFHTWRTTRAVKAGLRFRPAGQTVQDTLAWFRTQEKEEKGRKRLVGPTPEREATLLEQFAQKK